jgi:hypothetical protein
MSAVCSLILKHGGNEHDLPERCIQHLSSKVAFIHDWLLTSSSREHRQGSITGGEPSSVVRRMIIPPAHRCWPIFGAPPRAAHIPPRMSAAPSKEPSHAFDSISPSSRKSERRAPAGPLDQCRRSTGRRWPIDGIRRSQSRRSQSPQGRSTDDNSRDRSASLARLAPNLRRGRIGMSARPEDRRAAARNEKQPQRCERGGCSIRFRCWSLRTSK